MTIKCFSNLIIGREQIKLINWHNSDCFTEAVVLIGPRETRLPFTDDALITQFMNISAIYFYHKLTFCFGMIACQHVCTVHYLLVFCSMRVNHSGASDNMINPLHIQACPIAKLYTSTSIHFFKKLKKETYYYIIT